MNVGQVQRSHRRLAHLLLAIAAAGALMVAVFATFTDGRGWAGIPCAIGGIMFGFGIWNGVQELRFVKEVKGWDNR